MTSDDSIAGRSYPRVYKVSGRGDLHHAVSEGIRASGGTVVYASDPGRAPFYFGVQTDRGERFGLLIYAFRIAGGRTAGRAEDEIRGQLRFGSEESWGEQHPVARDVAGVDLTLLLGIRPDQGFFVALDPQLWDPLPMGISFYAKQANLDAMGANGWSVWLKDNHAGKRRTARSESGLETVVAFRPSRFLDYARFERSASDLGLDTPLRHSAAMKLEDPGSAPTLTAPHALEKQFHLTSAQILEIISTRTRLSVAVRGGVAEFHLQDLFDRDPAIAKAVGLDVDAMHDFNVTMKSGRAIRVECKNASPNRYADGSFRVEVQKTRASQGDRASRFYRVDAFDVVAACLYSPTGEWVFRFNRTTNLQRHREYADRISPMQKVDHTWASSLDELERLP